jgi:hypothetical protein
MSNAPLSSLDQSPASVRSQREHDVPRLVIISPSDDPDLFAGYCEGLHARYSEIGAGHLASASAGRVPSAEPTRTRLILLVTGRDVVGGVRVKEGADLAEQTGLEALAEPISARAPEGINEVKGVWLDPRFGGRGLALLMLQALVDVTARFPERWLLGFSNPRSLGPALKVGFAPDPRFENLPFPTPEMRSTVIWLDHHARMI